MIKNSATLFKEGRGNRRNQTMLSYSTAKDIITSAKELKNVRSTKQIDINSLMENKNQKIKNIDEKLDLHQSEINRNNQIIQQLNQNFVNLKVHLDKEKENSQMEEKKNKLLKEQIERTNKILRMKNNKIQELNKKVGETQKENESLRVLASKNEEYSKAISTLRTKFVNFQQTIADLKGSLGEKEKEISKLKEKVVGLQILKGKQQQMNNQLQAKDVLLINLKQSISEIEVERNKWAQQKLNLQNKQEKLNSQILNLKEANLSLKERMEAAEKKCNQFRAKIQNIQSLNKQSNLKIKSREKEQFIMKTEISELKIKNGELSNEVEQKSRLLGQKQAKIQKISQKIKQLESTLGQNYKQREKLKNFEEKVQILKKRVQNLQHLYYSVVPQIQCPFGHELNNPVTIIPCGHNYCLGCKKGYHKQCMQCNGKLKIEAVYRNQLMDDIIGMVGGIKQIIQILK